MNEYVMFADYHTRKMSITNVSFSLLVILVLSLTNCIVCVFTCVYYGFVCVYMYSVYACVYLCLHVYIYVFVCVCMCVYMLLFSMIRPPIHLHTLCHHYSTIMADSVVSNIGLANSLNTKSCMVTSF